MISGTVRSRVRSEPAADPAEQEVTAPGVLVVEDDPDVLDLVAAGLSERGYRVLGARDALDVMEDRSRFVAGFGSLGDVELVITDLVMPRASGVDLLRHMRMNGWSASALVISGYSDHRMWSEAFELGAVAVLHKPFRLEDLLHMVERLVPVRESPS